MSCGLRPRQLRNIKHMTLKINKTTFTISGLLLFAALFFYFQPSYIPTKLTSWLGLLFLPFITQHIPVQNHIVARQLSRKFAYCITGVAFLLLNNGNNMTLYYFTFCCFMLFWYEYNIARINYLPLAMLIVLSPIFQNILYVTGFPLRLMMSEWAAQIFQYFGMGVAISGNLITMNGHSFSVDPACAGINMLHISNVLALFVLGHFEREKEKILCLHHIGIALAAVSLLAILANFIRLLALIFLRYPPEDLMHDITGLLCLALYALLPFYLLASVGFRYCITKNNTSTTASALTTTQGISPKNLLLFVALAALLTLKGVHMQNPAPAHNDTLQKLQLSDFEKTMVKDGTAKFSNKVALIYIKPPVGPAGGAHDPRFCWKGSGYTFKHIRQAVIAGKDVYQAVLIKEEETLHTLWYYDSGHDQTIAESYWRWNTLLGKGRYYLVNVTAEREADLTEVVWQLSIQQEVFLTQKIK